jgi:hypothetical protein
MAIYRLGKSEPSIDKVDSAQKSAASDAANPSKTSSISCPGERGSCAAGCLAAGERRRKRAGSYAVKQGFADPFEKFVSLQDAWVAPSACVMGNVKLEKGATVWFNSTIRGDNDLITVGENSNIQDGCVLHSGHSSLLQSFSAILPFSLIHSPTHSLHTIPHPISPSLSYPPSLSLPNTHATAHPHIPSAPRSQCLLFCIIVSLFSVFLSHPHLLPLTSLPLPHR